MFSLFMNRSKVGMEKNLDRPLKVIQVQLSCSASGCHVFQAKPNQRGDGTSPIDPVVKAPSANSLRDWKSKRETEVRQPCRFQIGNKTTTKKKQTHRAFVEPLKRLIYSEMQAGRALFNTNLGNQLLGDADAAPSERSPTKANAIMHKDVIGHTGIHQEAPFSRRRQTRRAERSERRAGKHGRTEGGRRGNKQQKMVEKGIQKKVDVTSFFFF